MNRKYFCVKVECEEWTVESVMESVLKKTQDVDEERAKSNAVVVKNEGRGENSPWLERTGWKRMFAGKDMKELTSYVDINEGLLLLFSRKDGG
jgi:hypothetical protein